MNNFAIRICAGLVFTAIIFSSNSSRAQALINPADVQTPAPSIEVNIDVLQRLQSHIDTQKKIEATELSEAKSAVKKQKSKKTYTHTQKKYKAPTRSVTSSKPKRSAPKHVAVKQPKPQKKPSKVTQEALFTDTPVKNIPPESPEVKENLFDNKEEVEVKKPIETPAPQEAKKDAPLPAGIALPPSMAIAPAPVQNPSPTPTPVKKPEVVTPLPTPTVVPTPIQVAPIQQPAPALVEPPKAVQTPVPLVPAPQVQVQPTPVEAPVENAPVQIVPDMGSKSPVQTDEQKKRVEEKGKVLLTIEYNGSDAVIAPTFSSQLDKIIEDLRANYNKRLTIMSYAARTDGQAISARKISLSRGLAIRKYIIDKGIDNTRINVQALGDNTQAPLDRVDILLN